MLFCYKNIREDAERMINRWLNAYDKIDPSLNLYFSTKTGAHKYLEGNFLSLVQGLETYHRRMSNEKLMDENVFKELTETIVNQCPEEYRDWLSRKLKHGNEIILSNRIKSILEPFKNFFGTKKERKKLIRKIVDTRNYLTHYDESSVSMAVSGKELWSLCLKMEAIFQLHFLQVLGFTQENIKSILDNNYQLREKFKEIQ